MGLFSSIFKPVTDIVSDVGSAANKAVGVITPWNDSTTTGKLANMAVLAAAGYGASQLLNGASAASTTAGNLATATGTTAGTTTAGTGAAFTDGMWSGLNAGTVTPAYVGGTGEVVVGLGLPSESGSASFLSSLGNAAKKNPLTTGMLVSGGVQGVGSYLTAKEMAEIERDKMKPGTETTAKYTQVSAPDSGYNRNKPTSQPVSRTETAIQERIEKRYQTDPEYKRGFDMAFQRATGMTPEEAERFSATGGGLYSARDFVLGA